MSCDLVDCSRCGKLLPAKDGAEECVFCALKPIRPRGRICCHVDCTDWFTTNAKMHFQMEGDLMLSSDTGVPVEVSDEDVVEAVAVLYKTIFYLIGPLCSLHLNQSVNLMVSLHSERLIVSIANNRIERAMQEEWV